MTRTERFLSHLSRRTTSGQFIPEIDGLRFISIALVVLFHLSGFTQAKSGAGQFATPLDHALARVTATGHYGVQLFFIISGFVLALPFAAHHLLARPAPSLRAYYLRRLTRLEPPYVIAMVMIFLFAIMGYGLSAHDLWPHLLTSLAYLHNLMYGRGSILNVVAWSLEIEVQFYLLAPLLALVFAIAAPRLRRMVLIAGIAVALLAQALGATSDQRLALTLLNFIQFFLLGFLLADLYLTQWRESSARQGWWDAAGMFGWVSMMAVWVFIPEPRIIFPILAFLTFCAAFRGNVVKRVLSNRLLTTVGGMCYTIYLLHYPLISVLGRHSIGVGSTLPFAGHLLAQVMIVVPPLLLVSTVYFVLIERPCMNKDWPARLARHLRLGHLGPSRRDVAPVLPETPGVGSAPGTVTRA